jgi:hypothetical protein
MGEKKKKNGCLRKKKQKNRARNHLNYFPKKIIQKWKSNTAKIAVHQSKICIICCFFSRKIEKKKQRKKWGEKKKKKNGV